MGKIRIIQNGIGKLQWNTPMLAKKKEMESRKLWWITENWKENGLAWWETGGRALQEDKNLTEL